MGAVLIFRIKRAFEGTNGEVFRLHMDLFDLGGSESDFSRFRLSWIFFDSENPEKRVLMDNHKPIGLHLHFDQGPQIQVLAGSIEEAQIIFKDSIFKHFGFRLEEI